MTNMNVDSRPGDVEINSCCELKPSGILPAPRVGHTAVYYQKDKKVIIIGGATPGSLYNEVWLLDLHTLQCKLLELESKFDARYEHSAFFPDSTEARVWTFAGANIEENMNDLWEVNLDELKWSKLIQTGDVPPKRTYHTTTSMLKGKFVVFSGGAKAAAAITDPQVYQLDLQNKEWSLLPSKGQPPSPRQGHIMVTVDDKLFCHGGMCGTELYDDLHVLHSDGTWKQVECKQLQPCKRAAHGAAMHQRYVYIFGGLGDTGTLNDLWRLSVDTLEWEQIIITGSVPSCRLDFTLTLVELPTKFSENDDRICGDEMPFPFLLLHGGMNELGQLFDDFYVIRLP